MVGVDFDPLRLVGWRQNYAVDWVNDTIAGVNIRLGNICAIDLDRPISSNLKVDYLALLCGRLHAIINIVRGDGARQNMEE